jgi:hypothetical protein
MSSRPSLLVILAAAAMIGWLIFHVVSDRPATYETGTLPADEAEDASGEKEGESSEFGPERRARIESALRQKAGMF